MEHKLNTSSSFFSKRSLFRWTFASFALVIVLMSCKNKAASTLTKDDSIKISVAAAKYYKEIKDNAPKMRYLVFTAARQQALFNNNNDIKQIHYVLRQYPGKVYGLEAYGMDEAGTTRLTPAFELEQVPNTTPLPLYWCTPASLQINKRGHIKGLTDRGGLNQNRTIGNFNDLYFAPTQYGFSDDHNFSFYIIRRVSNTLMSNPKITIADEQGYTNPAPPFSFTCPGGCDTESYEP